MRLAEVITGRGFTVKRVEPASSQETGQPALTALVRMDAEPAFYKEGLARAKRSSRPVLLDFSAEWCGACHRLEEQTFKNPEVAEALEKFEVLVIDTDAHPELAQAYGVFSIPDVVLASSDGRILARFVGFEAAEPFLARLHKVRRLAGKQESGRR